MGREWILERARRAGRAREWSPPRVMSLGLDQGGMVEDEDGDCGFGLMAVLREPSSR